MQYLIDSANCDEIRRLADIYPITGVTTNPSIIAACRRPFAEVTKEIRAILGSRDLHVQTVALDCENILWEAGQICALLGENTYLKVPVNPQGLKAIRQLKEQGFKVTATAICSAQQAVLAASCGADYVVPYINRIADLQIDSIAMVREIRQIFNHNQLSSKILIASVKNSQQVHSCMLAGAHAVTLPPEFFDRLATHSRSESSIAQFGKDWQKAGLSF